jgi:hypothetical protein
MIHKVLLKSKQVQVSNGARISTKLPEKSGNSASAEVKNYGRLQQKAVSMVLRKSEAAPLAPETYPLSSLDIGNNAATNPG